MRHTVSLAATRGVVTLRDRFDEDWTNWTSSPRTFHLDLGGR